MIKAIFPGTFDPVTNGHLDIISRAAKSADELIILAAENSEKKCLFSVDERMEHLRYLTKHIKNVSVDCWSGLTADFVKNVSANAIIRGIRNGSDFDYELMVAEVNRKLAPQTETFFISALPELSYVRSSVVKEIACLGGNVNTMVPEYICDKLHDKFSFKTNFR